MKHSHLALLLFVASLAPATAHGAESAAQLFDEALAEMQQKNFASACPKLERSQEMEPRSGTLISLAFCVERLGKRGAAWHHYREAARLARAEGRAEYVAKATRLASELEPQLAPLRVSIASTPGLRATLDGVPLDPTRTEIFVDAGTHAVVAEAAGRRRYERVLEVPASGGSLEIPELALETVDAPPRALEPSPSPPPPVASPSSSLLVPGAVALAGGGASLVTSFVLGGLVLGHKSTVEAECDAERRVCSAAGLDAVTAGRALSIGSTVTFVVGLAGAGAGITLLAIGARGDDSATATGRLTFEPTPGGAGLGWMGRF
jgi:hypothetical protein